MRQNLLCILSFAFLAHGVLAQEKTFSNLFSLKKDYEAQVQAKVDQPHQEALADLNTKYTAALERAMSSAQQAAKLDEALALKSEKENIGSGTGVPELDEAGTLPSLKTLRATYRLSLAKLEMQRAKRLEVIVKEHSRLLDGLTQKLTKEGKLDEAKAAREQSENLLKDSNPTSKRGASPNHASAGKPPASSTPVAGLDLHPSDYFEGAVSRDLDSALKRSKEIQKPVWIIAYGRFDDKQTRHWRIHYFMELAETKKLVKANFIQVMIPFSTKALKPFLIEGDNLEIPILFIVSPRAEIIEKRVLNHNGNDGLRLTKEFVQKAQQVK